MAERKDNLLSLVIAALDELEHLKRAQEIFEISLEQLDTTEKSQVRLEVLLSSGLAELSLRHDELQNYLNKIRRLVAPAAIPGHH